MTTARANSTVPPSATAPLALLDPNVLSKISRLDMVARQVMDGYVQGMHKSKHIDFAIDFAQHRQYVPGDDVKRIDWRLLAKSDRYYIKQYEVTTNLRALIIMDCSGSMAYRGQAAMSKYRYGQFMAASLAYLTLHQQDSVGLITVDNAIRDFIPPRSTPSHLINIVSALEARPAGGESSLAVLLHEIAEQLTQRGLVIMISDFFETPDALISALHHFRHRRHEVLMLHVMADDELNFPFRKWTLFQNMESTQHRLRLDPAMMRRHYLDNLRAHLTALRRTAADLNISYSLFNTSNPFDDALSMYLANRMRGRRA
jgi:uncharacterized protein (DUF58 family)